MINPKTFYGSLSVGDKMALFIPLLSIIAWWLFVGRRKYGSKGLSK
jgi:hypothetical protein